MSKPKTAQQFVQKAINQARRAHKERVGADKLQIWGGHFSAAADDFAQFLLAWQTYLVPSQLEWALVEEMSRFYAAKTTDLIADLPLQKVERLRLFGTLGDLDIRRDCDRFLWRLVGETAVSLPQPAFANAQSYWEAQNAEQKARQFARVERDYRQWNRDPLEQRITHEWAANLFAEKTAVSLKQVHYLENGRIAFVRFVEFEEQPK